MKNSGRKSVLTELSGVCLCLLCSGALAGEPGAVSQPAENTTTDSRVNTSVTNPGHKDVLDRAFSPLDKAVSDINHDINEGDDNEAPETAAPQPEKNATTGTRTDTTATKPRHEDILDRAFSPLDKAVSDINRDINSDIDKGDDKKAPETDQ